MPASAGVLRYSGTPVPGARLAIELEGSADPNATYSWIQYDGPTVPLGDPTGPRIQVTVPPDARRLGFILSIRDPGGLRTARVIIPIEAPAGRDAASAPSPASPSASTPRADSGDDQIGLVGRRITLNGTRSTPRGGVAYRWLALAGPRVEQVMQEGPYFSFTPTAAGTYRLGLVVASARGGETSISELDEVVVTVGELPSALGVGAPGVPTAAIDQMLQGPGGPAGRMTLEQAAGIFDAIAARATLYSNFGDLSSEMIRRLDAAIPSDQNWRQFWSQGVFAPLTQHLVGEMLSTGLDLRNPPGQNQPLGPTQQDRLQKLFTSYAREFRSRAQGR